MRIQQTCVRLLLVAMWLSVATLASAPAPARAQSTSGEWHAWNMKVDFPPPPPGQSRMPRVRYGQVHLYNNFLEGSVASVPNRKWGSGMAVGTQGDVLAQGNFFHVLGVKINANNEICGKLLQHHGGGSGFRGEGLWFRSDDVSALTPQLVDAAVADDAHVAGAQAERAAHGIGRLLVVEAQHQHRTLALGQPLQAVRDALVIEPRRDVQVGDRDLVGMAPQQLLAPTLAAQQVDHRHAAGAEHERHDARRLVECAGAQLLDRQRHHVLHQVVCGMVVAQAHHQHWLRFAKEDLQRREEEYRTRYAAIVERRDRSLRQFAADREQKLAELHATRSEGLRLPAERRQFDLREASDRLNRDLLVSEQAHRRETTALRTRLAQAPPIAWQATSMKPTPLRAIAK